MAAHQSRSRALIVLALLQHGLEPRARPPRSSATRSPTCRAAPPTWRARSAELDRRIGAARKPRSDRSARQRVDPVAAEIGELGGLVKQLAETVAAHESELYRRIATRKRQRCTGARGRRLRRLLLRRAEPAPAPKRRQPANDADVPRRFAGLTREGINALITSAVDANRIDLYLQPIVTLPQRKVRYYEAMSRLRTEDGDVMPAADFIEHAEAAGLMPKIDNLLLFRCVQVVRRLQLKNREVGLFCNISATTLTDRDSTSRSSSNSWTPTARWRPSLMFEFSQSALCAIGPIENEAWRRSPSAASASRWTTSPTCAWSRATCASAASASSRCRPSCCSIATPAAPTDIHPADLSDLLARFGIDLIAEQIESESMVVDLLDYDVRFGQGFLFSPPRPVRAEALQIAAALTNRRRRPRPTAPSAAERGGRPPLAQRRRSRHFNGMTALRIHRAFLRARAATTTSCCPTSGASCTTASRRRRRPATRCRVPRSRAAPWC